MNILIGYIVTAICFFVFGTLFGIWIDNIYKIAKGSEKPDGGQ